MTARRLNSIAPFHVMALLARARELEAQGRSIVHMEIGEPDFATPQPVVEAGIRALQQGKTRYTPAVGLRELREAIADHYLRQFEVRIDPRRILVTPGASGALQLILAMLVDPGSQVLMTDPGYPCNRNFVFLFEGEPVMVPVEAQQHYQLSAELLEQYWSERTCCVMVASPSNPTGTVISPDKLEALLQKVRDRGGHLIVDEIYQSLWYGEAPHTALALGEDVFVINSFSKYFGMTGWRLGWLVAPQDASHSPGYAGTESVSFSAYTCSACCVDGVPAGDADDSGTAPAGISAPPGFFVACLAGARIRYFGRAAGCFLPVCKLRPLYAGQFYFCD